MNLDVTRFLEDVSGRYARQYADLVADMVVAVAKDNRAALARARDQYGEVARETLGIGEVLGASIVLRDAAGVMGSAAAAKAAFKHSNRYTAVKLLRFAAEPTQNVLPRVTFAEAVEDMVTRSPTTIRNAAERTATNISKLYGEGRVVAFAKSAEQAVTDRVQSLIAEAIANGTEEAAVGKMIKTTVAQIRKDTADWSEAYARMAFRTNLNTATQAGKWRQGLDPDINSIMPAVQFVTAGDVDVRDNHKAGHKKIMLRTNPRWNDLASPLDYNCRCDSRDVSIPELRRMGRVRTSPTAGFTPVEGVPNLFIREDVPSAAWHPAEGFRHGRPDLFLGVPA